MSVDSWVKFGVDYDTAKAKKGIKELDSANKEFEKKSSEAMGNLKGGIQKAGIAATVTGGAMVAAMYGAVQKANNLNETLNVTDTIFADNKEAVREWAKTAITEMGMSEEAALRTRNTFGAMGKSMKVEGWSEMSEELTQLSADLGSFYNLDIDQASTALKGIFTGEGESLKQLGIMIDEATLKQYGYNSAMTPAEKAQIRYKAVLDQTVDAQGDFSKTSDGLSNQQRIMKEQFNQLTTEVGNQLVPMFTTATTAVTGWLGSILSSEEGIKNFTDKVLMTIKVIGIIIGVILTVNAIMWAYSAVTTIVSIAQDLITLKTKLMNTELVKNTIGWMKNIGQQVLAAGSYVATTAATWLQVAAAWALNSAWLANPITWIVLGVVAAIAILIGAFILMRDNWDAICSWFNNTITNIKNWFINLWQSIVDKWNWCKDMLMNGINAIKGFFSGLWDAVVQGAKNAMNGLIAALNLIPTGIEFLINGAISGLEKICGLINMIPGVNIDFNFGRVNIPKIPSLAIGTNMVNSDGLAFLHKNEMVVPAADVASGGFSSEGKPSGISIGDFNMTIEGNVDNDNIDNIIAAVNEGIGKMMGVNYYGN